MKVVKGIAIFDNIIDFNAYWRKHPLKFESKTVYIVARTYDRPDDTAQKPKPYSWEVEISGCREHRAVCTCYRRSDAIQIAQIFKKGILK
jgi:hypothetical protein